MCLRLAPQNGEFFWSLGSAGKQYFSQLSFLGCKCNKLEDLVKLQQERVREFCVFGAVGLCPCPVHSLSLRMGSSRMKLLRFLLWTVKTNSGYHNIQHLKIFLKSQRKYGSRHYTTMLLNCPHDARATVSGTYPVCRLEPEDKLQMGVGGLWNWKQHKQGRHDQ